MVYRFHCPECPNTFEAQVALGTTEHKCPECGKPAGKIFTPANVKIPRGWGTWTISDIAAPYSRKVW